MFRIVSPLLVAFLFLCPNTSFANDGINIVGHPFFAPIVGQPDNQLLQPRMTSQILDEYKSGITAATPSPITLLCRSGHSEEELEKLGLAEFKKPDMVIIARKPFFLDLGLCQGAGYQVVSQKIAEYKGGLPEDKGIKGIWIAYLKNSSIENTLLESVTRKAKRITMQKPYSDYFSVLDK